MILVTGGCGYIGSHTLVDLLSNGHDVISIDNFSNSSSDVVDSINRITNYSVKNYNIDICNLVELENIFKTHKIDSIIHFASFKSVPESVSDPLKYYDNNLIGLINLLKCSENFGLKNFIFSSSCSVYGDPTDIPVTESAIMMPKSPYAVTKYFSEQIIEDFSKVNNIKFISLRYFNPIGCHPSLEIGEISSSINVLSRILATHNRKQEKLFVFGKDWPTIDGTCIRDYIHVCDVAESHRIALEVINTLPNNLYKINIGRGTGISVLELIKIFEYVSDSKLDYELVEKRTGDVCEVWSDVTYCKNILKWSASRSIEDAVYSSYLYSKKINKKFGSK